VALDLHRRMAICTGISPPRRGTATISITCCGRPALGVIADQRDRSGLCLAVPFGDDHLRLVRPIASASDHPKDASAPLLTVIRP